MVNREDGKALRLACRNEHFEAAGLLASVASGRVLGIVLEDLIQPTHIAPTAMLEMLLKTGGVSPKTSVESLFPMLPSTAIYGTTTMADEEDDDDETAVCIDWAFRQRSVFRTAPTTSGSAFSRWLPSKYKKRRWRLALLRKLGCCARSFLLQKRQSKKWSADRW